jgi:CheY-like chemotaxis protein
MDIRMPAIDGLAATELLRARDNPPEVIVLTTFEATITRRLIGHVTDQIALLAHGAGEARAHLLHR